MVVAYFFPFISTSSIRVINNVVHRLIDIDLSRMLKWKLNCFMIVIAADLIPLIVSLWLSYRAIFVLANVSNWNNSHIILHGKKINWISFEINKREKKNRNQFDFRLANFQSNQPIRFVIDNDAKNVGIYWMDSQ